ncbi:hypothetical protein EMIT0232MI5_40441 [Pseudomonas sp. IT-232MI5]
MGHFWVSGGLGVLGLSISGWDCCPHPSPLPEGEGTDRVVYENYADLRYRVELKFRKQHRSAPSPLGEGWGEGLRS